LTERPCEEEVPENETIVMYISADGELEVGQELSLAVLDLEGNPVTADIILIKPDGTQIRVEDNDYIVDQPGVWTIKASKEGYTDAEAEANVKEAPVEEGKPVTEVVAEAIGDAVKEVTREPTRFALLLVTVILLVGAFVFWKKRHGKKKGVESL
jgi:hypothetical protein